MNKAELVDRLAKDANLSKTQSEEFLTKALQIIQQSVARGEEVKIVGFGTFDRSKRKSRTGRNPKTGATVQIPAATVPRFRPGKEFKKILGKSLDKITRQNHSVKSLSEIARLESRLLSPA